MLFFVPFPQHWQGEFVRQSQTSFISRWWCPFFLSPYCVIQGVILSGNEKFSFLAMTIAFALSFALGQLTYVNPCICIRFCIACVNQALGAKGLKQQYIYHTSSLRRSCVRNWSWCWVVLISIGTPSFWVWPSIDVWTQKARITDSFVVL